MMQTGKTVSSSGFELNSGLQVCEGVHPGEPQTVMGVDVALDQSSRPYWMPAAAGVEASAAAVSASAESACKRVWREGEERGVGPEVWVLMAARGLGLKCRRPPRRAPTASSSAAPVPIPRRVKKARRTLCRHTTPV